MAIAKQASLAISSLLAISGCSGDHIRSVAQLAPASPCQYSISSPTVATQRSALRGLLVVHSHGHILTDAKCPDISVILFSVEGGPDISLCDSDTLSRRFGCPAGGDKGPVLTVVGDLSHTTGMPATMTVHELKDLEDVPSANGA